MPLQSVLVEDLRLEASPRWNRVALVTQVASAWLVVGLMVVTVVMNRVSVPAWVVEVGIPQSDAAVIAALLAGSLLMPRRMQVLPWLFIALAGLLVIATYIAKLSTEHQRLLPIWADNPYGSGSMLMSWLSLAWLTLVTLAFAAGHFHSHLLRTASSVLSVLAGMGLIALALGHIFTVSDLVTGSPEVHNSAITFITFLALSLSWVGFWSRHGQWRTLRESGLAASSLRVVCFVAFFMPMAFAAVVQFFARSQWLANELADAAYASMISFAALIMGLMLFDRLRTREHRLYRAARMDELTGTANMRAFEELSAALNSEKLQRNFRQIEPHEVFIRMTVAVIDVDDLKKVNDQLGHAIGSELLARFGACLRELATADVVPFRMGGDEFALVALHPADEPLHLCEKLAKEVAQENQRGESVYRIRYSCGSATGKPDSIAHLLREADEKMYANKQARKRRAKQLD